MSYRLTFCAALPLHRACGPTRLLRREGKVAHAVSPPHLAMLPEESTYSHNIADVNNAVAHRLGADVVAVVVGNAAHVGAEPACYRCDIRNVGVAIAVEVGRPRVPQSFVLVGDAARRWRSTDMELVAVRPAVAVSIRRFLREGELYAQHKERAAEHT